MSNYWNGKLFQQKVKFIVMYEKWIIHRKQKCFNLIASLQNLTSVKLQIAISFKKAVVNLKE